MRPERQEPFGAHLFTEYSARIKKGIFGKTIYMIKVDLTINAIKQTVKSLCGKDVSVKLNLGRNKYVTFPATVSEVYPSLFTVSPYDKSFLGKTAYSYSEILCGRVKITEAEGGAAK